MLKLATIVLLTTVVVAQDSPHQQGVETRGDQAMGFFHQMTTHHFALTNDGGVIEVEADNPNDKASRDAIRQHLNHIATLFSQGDFDLPMFIHAQTPPGVPTMKRLKEQIKYEAQTTDKGAEVKIATTNPEAVSAIHQFLRFQIQDHHTGDPTEAGH
jgi:TusA-related sulfurtransferase